MSRVRDLRRFDVAFVTLNGRRNAVSFNMRRMCTDREIGETSLAAEAFRRRTGLIVTAAVAGYAGPLSRSMADITDRNVAGEGIDNTVDVEILAGNSQRLIYHIGMTIGTSQSERGDMELVFPEEIGRIIADIMARTAGGLIGTGPLRCIGSLTAHEISVTIGTCTTLGCSIPV